MQTLSSPAAEALRQTVRGALTPMFDRFLVRLPETLVQTLPGNAQRSAADELAYSVTVDRMRWLAIFVRQVDVHLIGNVAEPAAIDSALEAADSIAMANIELRGEALHQALIWELDTKLDSIRRSVYVPIYARAVAPAGLCRALQDTALAMGCSDLQRRLLFAQFDVLVISDLQPFYRSVIDALSDLRARAGAMPAGRGGKAVTPPSEQNATVVPAPPAPPPGTAAGGEARPRLDARTASMLQSFAATAGQSEYHDGSLAADLLALNSDTPVAGIAPERSWVPLQRIELAGQFLNEAISDPLVSEDLRPQHEAVRFPLVKSALTDATLFTAVTHPLRSLVNDLMLKSATSRVTGSMEARHMADVLRQVLVQFDLAPDFVREAMLDAQPIEPEQIQQFLEMQRQQARQRREAVIAEAKRQVVRKLELATFGRMLPAQAIRFLNTVWGPLLVKRLLQYGADQPPCTSALSLMDQMLDQLDGLAPGQPPSPVWLSLMRAMGAELIVTGLAAARVKEAIAALESAWKRADPGFQAEGL